MLDRDRAGLQGDTLWADPADPAACRAEGRRWVTGHSRARDWAILVGFVALGVLVTWPRASYLADGLLPNTRDQAAYVWDMWWMAHQVEHFSNPFTTQQIFAPIGAPLAYHDLMPIVGLIMMPFTVTGGPAFSVNLLSVLLPGLLCYVMYRAARLWLPPVGALTSGLFFGLSSMLAWRAWFQLNIAVGALFLPLAVEMAVRMRRRPSAAGAARLGLVVGLCLLVDLESTVLATLTAALVLVGWLFTRPNRHQLALLGLAGGVTLVVASPQIIAMVQQAAAVAPDPTELARDYVTYGVALPQMFSPSPRVSSFGLHWFGALFYDGIPTEGIPTFGVTLTVLAVLGAVIGWRTRLARTWLAAFLGACLLALGPVLYLPNGYTPLGTRFHGQTLSLLLPYTWFVRLPGLASFREANRFTELGLLVPATLLAGAGVVWIKQRFAPALVLVAILAGLELGWSAVGSAGTMPAGLPAVDRAIMADHSQSLVVDVPLGFRSGTVELGPGFPAEELVEATLDGHPRAIGYVARLPEQTIAALRGHPFYADLLEVQEGATIPAIDIPAAIADSQRMKVGWVLVWTPPTPTIRHFLNETGFSLRQRTDGVSVYRATTDRNGS